MKKECKKGNACDMKHDKATRGAANKAIHEEKIKVANAAKAATATGQKSDKPFKANQVHGINDNMSREEMAAAVASMQSKLAKAANASGTVYEPVAAEDSWQKTVNFLKTYLD